MTDSQLIAAIEAKGFHLIDMGGNCQALFRMRSDANGVTVSDVISDSYGGSLPSETDWMLCTYLGEYVTDIDCEPDIISTIDSDVSPVDLLTAVDL